MEKGEKLKATIKTKHLTFPIPYLTLQDAAVGETPFRTWSRNRHRHFESVEKEASVAAGSGWSSRVRPRGFTLEIPPVQPSHLASGQHVVKQEPAETREGESSLGRRGIQSGFSCSCSGPQRGLPTAAQCQSRNRLRPTGTPLGITARPDLQ